MSNQYLEEKLFLLSWELKLLTFILQVIALPQIARSLLNILAHTFQYISIQRVSQFAFTIFQVLLQALNFKFLCLVLVEMHQCNANVRDYLFLFPNFFM